MKKSGFVYVKTIEGEIRLIRTAKEAGLSAGDCVLVSLEDGGNIIAQCVSGSFEVEPEFIGKMLSCDPEALPIVASLLVPEMSEGYEANG